LRAIPEGVFTCSATRAHAVVLNVAARHPEVIRTSLRVDVKREQAATEAALAY